MTSGGRIRTRLLLGGHDGALREFRTVTTESGGTYRSLILRTQVHESHDSGMWMSNPRIRGPVADPLDVMTCRAQNRHGAATHTCVERNLHDIEDSTSAGSMRSCPTRRRAYTKHARMSSGSSHG